MLHSNVVAVYQPVQALHVRRLLSRLYDEPARFREHLKQRVSHLVFAGFT